LPSILCTNKFAGWVRDLTLEGIEPNPGPTWDELLEAITKKFKAGMPTPVGDALSKIYSEICDAHKDDSNFMFPDTGDVLEYLDKNSVPSKLANLIKETITSLQSGTGTQIYLTYSYSSTTPLHTR
jgi:hypothetical protein